MSCHWHFITLPPSKVRPKCKTIVPIRQKVWEHEKTEEHTPINYYWRMRFIIYSVSRVRMVFAHALYMHKAPRVLHFSAFHLSLVLIKSQLWIYWLFTNILPEAICCCLETFNVYVVLLMLCIIM